MASLDVLGVHKEFGATPILRGIDIRIADGEFLTLVGPSGCGKSTLLRLIAGLEEITDGQIHIDGTLVNELAPKDRDIAMVFQNYALYPHMSVAENMGFALEMRGESKTRIAERVASAAGILGLQPLLKRYPRQLSGGQRQRVAMGRAIVRDPKVFLFDEPLSNLDAQLRVAMRAEIKALHQRLKTTTVYVTHDQIEAMTMADRIVVMRAGIVEQIGTPLDLYDRPANTFVATFIGSPAMNLVAGTLVAGANGLTFTSDGGQTVVLPEAIVAGAPAGAVKVRLGFRPEHVDLADIGLEATVIVVEPTGSETHILAEVEGRNTIVVLRDRVAVAPGATIRLRPQPAKAHVFSAETGERL